MERCPPLATGCKVAIFALCVEVAASVATARPGSGAGAAGRRNCCLASSHCVMACFGCFACTWTVGKERGGGGEGSGLHKCKNPWSRQLFNPCWPANCRLNWQGEGMRTAAKLSGFAAAMAKATATATATDKCRL